MLEILVYLKLFLSLDSLGLLNQMEDYLRAVQIKESQESKDQYSYRKAAARRSQVRGTKEYLKKRFLCLRCSQTISLIRSHIV